MFGEGRRRMNLLVNELMAHGEERRKFHGLTVKGLIDAFERAQQARFDDEYIAKTSPPTEGKSP